MLDMRKRGRDLEGTLSFVLLAISILILLFKFLYAIFSSDGLSEMPFLAPLSDSTIEKISADWIVFITLLTHVIRIKFGIAFLKYDKSYLDAGKELKLGPKDELRRNQFIILNAVFATLVAAFVSSSYPSYLILIILLFQAVLILAYDWYTKEQLFVKDTDRKANFLILAGDIAFFFFCSATLIFHLSIDLNLSTISQFLLGYFCLIAFAVFELLTLVLLIESFFTYKEGLKHAYSTFKQTFLTGDFEDVEV